MSVLYSFETDDGEVLEKRFPMGECPPYIMSDSGKKAHRVFGCNVSMFGNGHVSGDAAMKLNADMKSRQERAGKRMRDTWKSVNPNTEQ